MGEDEKVTTPIENHWDHGSLWAKTQLYVEIALESDREMWFYPFWSALALEFLARTALATVSPTLLADTASGDDNNLLHALDKAPPTPNLKSVGAEIVYRRCEKLFASFTGEHKSFCSGFTGRRNQELHSGATPFEDLKTQGWLPRYYEVCEALVGTMTKTLEDLLGDEEADAARKMIEAMRDEKAKQVRQEIGAHEIVWKGKSLEEKQASMERAKSFALPSSGHVILCPACGCPALLKGEEISRRQPALEDDLVVERVTMLPTQLTCVACSLQISGHSKLHAVEFGATYTATSSQDPIEYYGGEGYDWDDQNE